MSHLFYRSDDDAPTFAKDHLAPSLPLPTLDNTLRKYYESLLPFGNEKELQYSKTIIEKFKNGIGKELHKVLMEKAKNEKNWVERWWEDYAYLSDRNPIYPFCAMAQPLLFECVNVEESTQYNLKSLARNLYHTLEFWKLFRYENFKTGTNKDGSVTLSSYLFRRFFNCARIPGEQMDRIVSHFRTESEGDTPTHIVVIGRGRLFLMECLNSIDGSILSVQDILFNLRQIHSQINEYPAEYAVPVLTCDNRTNWAKNRQYLIELCEKNGENIDIIEKCLILLSLDEHEPSDWSETAIQTLTADFHSRWADKSSVCVAFANGKLGYVGEHSCYDGTISITFSTFILTRLFECSDIDWDKPISKNGLVPIVEMRFEIDEHIKKEIKRVEHYVDVELKPSIVVSTSPFTGYGRGYLKTIRLHPDSFVQMILQLTYFKIHQEFVATYETALMRNYYNARTETVRSCTIDSINWVKSFLSLNDSNEIKYELLKKAINTHHRLMTEARKGEGIDRHLFGLWCVAFEAGQTIPEIYDDVLYRKSGGGGNYILSTSTLGFTINNGFVAPMCLDGYGTFYSITNDNIWLMASVFRKSIKTSGHKFVQTFHETLVQVKAMIESVIANGSSSKL